MQSITQRICWNREITRQVPFLHDKDPRFIEMIAPKMTLLTIADGEYVVKEGERGQDLFFLLSGAVKCEYETDDGETLTLINHEAGQYFGDVAMFLLEVSPPACLPWSYSRYCYSRIALSFPPYPAAARAS